MLEERLHNAAKETENLIEEVLPASAKAYKSVVEAMRYSLLSGGKRIRPFILNEFYRIFSGDYGGSKYFALAIEMIHTYSLIHDDLPCMDNDDLRRGKPSCHKQFGEATALLAGDGLLTQAFYVASLTEKTAPERVIKALAILSNEAGYKGMIGGQVIDLESENKEVGIETVTELNLLKTGALIKAAATIGATLGGADEKTVEKCAEYAQNLGLAFQITDDILDNTSDSTTLGKPVKSDERNNKSTYVSILGLDECRKTAKRLTEKAIKILDEIDGDTESLKQLTEYLLNRDY